MEDKTKNEGQVVYRETAITVADGLRTVYTATVEAHTAVTLALGEAQLFSHQGETLRMCGCRVEGAFGAGEYGLRVVINPAQGVLLVDVTLPDGGTIRRGDYRLLGGDVLRWYGYGEASDMSAADKSAAAETAAAETAAAEAAITEHEIAYTPVTPEPYTRVTREPVCEGFSAGVYNLVNCFDCPRTTRLFAWTALRSFVGEQAMALQYRAVGNEAWAEVPAKERYQTDDRGEVFGHERYFAADVTGLSPDTAYEYRVAVVGEGAPVGEWHAFRTAPEEIGDFRFVAVGDTQGHNWDWNSYCKAAVDKAFSQVPDAAFLFNLGDMADAGFSLELWNLYFKAVGEHTATRPHFAVVGNHDTLVRDGEHNSRFSLHFHHPQNGAGALDMSFEQEAFYDSLKSQFKHPEEAIYSFDYGNAHFTVLHTGSYCPRDRAILEAQRAWLAADLEAHKDAKWKILCFHEPVYHRRGDGESRPWLFDTIEEYGVDLVLLGHSHLVTRTYPMKDGQIAVKTSPDSIRKGTGTVHVTVGSTTLSHDDMGDPNMEYCMLIHTPPNEQAAYTTVSVKEDRIEVVIKQLDGYVVDEFVIEE